MSCGRAAVTDLGWMPVPAHRSRRAVGGRSASALYGDRMTARDDVAAAFNASHDRIKDRLGPSGVLPREGTDGRMVIINETNKAIEDALYALADRLDALEANKRS